MKLYYYYCSLNRNSILLLLTTTTSVDTSHNQQAAITILASTIQIKLKQEKQQSHCSIYKIVDIYMINMCWMNRIRVSGAVITARATNIDVYKNNDLS